MRRILYIAAGCLCVAMAGCRDFSNPFASEKPLAKVGDKSLYFSDIESIFTPDITRSDSLHLLESYVDMWIKQELKTQEAERILQDDQQDMDRMVEEYRHSLLNNRLDQYYVDRMLDTTFTEREIETYYTGHRNDFILDRPIVKGEIVKIPANYRQHAKLKELMKSEKEADRQDFLDICLKNNFTRQEFTVWTDFPKFAKQLPDRQDDAILKKEGIQEITSNGDRYFFQITACKQAGDVKPLNRVNDGIRRVLYNQRRSEIVHWYEDSIYKAALQNKTIIVNIP